MTLASEAGCGIVCNTSGASTIQILSDSQFLGAIFAALLGLAFGSFLNVVISRLPEDESIITPGSHCRNCAHSLAWWENLPVLSWLILRGRCRSCRTRISIRYPLIELAIGILWTGIWIRSSDSLVSGDFDAKFRGCWGEQLIPHHGLLYSLTTLAGYALLSWLLVALAALDAEHFWLPDILTLPGIGLGLASCVLLAWAAPLYSLIHHRPGWTTVIWERLVESLVAAGIVLFIRLAYWLVRRKEGMGLGDAKLMAMLGAWLGLVGALESFAIAVLGATVAAVVWLAVLALRRDLSQWAKMPLPLGTFLCLAALSEIFYPAWFWNWWSRTFLLYSIFQ